MKTLPLLFLILFVSTALGQETKHQIKRQLTISDDDADTSIVEFNKEGKLVFMKMTSSEDFEGFSMDMVIAADYETRKDTIRAYSAMFGSLLISDTIIKGNIQYVRDYELIETSEIQNNLIANINTLDDLKNNDTINSLLVPDKYYSTVIINEPEKFRRYFYFFDDDGDTTFIESEFFDEEGNLVNSVRVNLKENIIEEGWIYEYDSDSKIIKEISLKPNNYGGFDTISVDKYYYDNKGNQILRKSWYRDESSISYEKETMTYNKQGEMINSVECNQTYKYKPDKVDYVDCEEMIFKLNKRGDMIKTTIIQYSSGKKTSKKQYYHEIEYYE